MSTDESVSSSVTGTRSHNSTLSDVTSSDAVYKAVKASKNGITRRQGGGFREHSKTSVNRASSESSASDSNESISSNVYGTNNKPHKANDKRWDAIQNIRVRDGAVGLSHFRLLKRLGCGDIGSVYLAELKGTSCCFAMKVMDKVSLASRKKELRAQTEREILASLDHPFLPTLYSHFETEKFSCLVMEYCIGGDLHTLRQRQPGKHFTEQAARIDDYKFQYQLPIHCN